MIKIRMNWVFSDDSEVTSYTVYKTVFFSNFYPIFLEHKIFESHFRHFHQNSTAVHHYSSVKPSKDLRLKSIASPIVLRQSWLRSQAEL